MSEEYLNKTGLSYFWSKIKAWANAAFAAISHSHGNVTNDGKLGTASRAVVADSNKKITTSFVTTTELEYVSGVTSAIQTQLNNKAADNGVIHTTGNETANGVKTFNDLFKGLGGIETDNSGFYTKTDLFNDTDSVTEHTYQSLIAAKDVNNNPMMDIYYGRHEDDVTLLAFRLRNKDRTKAGYVQFVYWPSTDVFILEIPTAPETATGSAAVNSYWVRRYASDTYLPLTGGTLTGSVKYKRSNHTRGIAPSANNYIYLTDCVDSANNRIGLIETAYLTDKSSRISIFAYNTTVATGGNIGSLGIGCTSAGNVYTFAPTPATSDNSTQIATTAFVKAQGYLTSHQSLSNYCTLNEAQTISATKTFSKVQQLYREAFHRGSSTDYLQFSGGSAWNLGARITLYGESHASGAGYVNIRASSSSQTKLLSAQPGGTFQWDGQNIQVGSDERIKTPLASVPDAVLDAWGDVQWGQFQYLEAVAEKGESARLHLGLIAQRVKAVFEARELDACKYGVLCHEERPATDEEPAVDLWMARYAEAQAMEAAYQRRENARLKKRIADLEERLAALELKVS